MDLRDLDRQFPIENNKIIRIKGFYDDILAWANNFLDLDEKTFFLYIDKDHSLLAKLLNDCDFIIKTYDINSNNKMILFMHMKDIRDLEHGFDLIDLDIDEILEEGIDTTYNVKSKPIINRVDPIHSMDDDDLCL